MFRCGPALPCPGRALRLLLFVSICALGWSPPAVHGQTFSDLLREVLEANPESKARSDSSQERSTGGQETRVAQWHTERELTADLSEIGPFEVDGEHFVLWANMYQVVLIQMSERSYRKLTDLKDRRLLFLAQAAQDIVSGVVSAFAPKHPYLAGALAAWSAASDLVFVLNHGADYWEEIVASSRVALYDFSGERIPDRIDPAKEYSLGFFFKTSPFQCRWSDDGCWLDLELSLEVWDSFEYSLDAVEVARGTNRPWSDVCYGGYWPVIQEDGPECLRRENRETISFPIGSLRIEPGHYMIIPREPIVFDLPQPSPRTGETVRVFKKVQLSDSKGLFSRNVSFLIDAPADAPEDSGEDPRSGPRTAGSWEKLLKEASGSSGVTKTNPVEPQSLSRTDTRSGDLRLGSRSGESAVFDGIEFVWIPPGRIPDGVDESAWDFRREAGDAGAHHSGVLAGEVRGDPAAMAGGDGEQSLMVQELRRKLSGGIGFLEPCAGIHQQAQR